MDKILAGVWFVTALTAFFLSAWLGKRFIPVLHRLKFGQTIREEGPAWHKSKQGTPTMGGILFIAAMVIVTVVVAAACQLLLPVKPVQEGGFVENVRWIAGLLMAVGFGAIGFADDYIKVVKKRNLGLTSRQKLLGQLVVATAYALTLYFTDATIVHIPFYGWWDAGVWFIPGAIFILVAMTNATNLTDGVDGLCASTAVIATLVLLALCGTYEGCGILAAAMAGALSGFLVWNLHPAKVFMGDTGSLFIGGVLCAVAFGVGKPLLLLPVGFVYFCETLSVMLQVAYFKLTHGKRLFKMSPIHHHFELCGWSENKIVTVACIVTALGGAIAVVLA